MRTCFSKNNFLIHFIQRIFGEWSLKYMKASKNFQWDVIPGASAPSGPSGGAITNVEINLVLIVK
jgi:hypothetical protein